jgi:multiple sugar transport system substrate-binding protein
MSTNLPKVTLAAFGALTLTFTLAACSAGSDQPATNASGGSGSGGTYTVWDPYPQHEADSAWAKRIDACGEEAGVTIERTAYDTQALTNQALLAAQEGSSADVILLDNPAVSTLAETGALVDMETVELDTSAIEENLLAAGELDGATYGIPVGANTLALYYNADILTEAGIDPASITDWDSLTSALQGITDAGHKGITFAGIGTEEGSFQFLPFFWGSGAELTALDSEDAVSALDLWTGWVNDGLAPNSVINNSQNTVWEEFLTGDFGFAVNGTWQVNSAAEAGFETGYIPIPAKDGGVAPAPTGGEFMLMPVQDDEARYDTSKKIIECMSTTEGQVETATTFAYYIPATTEGQDLLLEETPDLQVWVDAVNEAKGRTSDNLGTDYPVISEQLWTAVQNALSGSASPEEALKTAQQDAAAGLGQ